jgi:hypothetical protein
MNIKITIIAFAAGLLTGCVTTTVNVIDHKPVNQPFSRVLCFYLDEGCDFSLFDSTLYNICEPTPFGTAGMTHEAIRRPR